MLTAPGQIQWLLLIGGAFVLLWVPLIIAAVRGNGEVGRVFILTLLTPCLGVSWLLALGVAVFTPRTVRLPAGPAPWR